MLCYEYLFFTYNDPMSEWVNLTIMYQQKIDVTTKQETKYSPKLGKNYILHSSRAANTMYVYRIKLKLILILSE